MEPREPVEHLRGIPVAVIAEYPVAEDAVPPGDEGVLVAIDQSVQRRPLARARVEGQAEQPWQGPPAGRDPAGLRERDQRFKREFE